jgi:hypothetical protein
MKNNNINFFNDLMEFSKRGYRMYTFHLLVFVVLIKLKPKDHTQMYTIIKFKNSKLDLPESQYYKLSKEIEKKIGKKYIFDLNDIYFSNGKLTLFLKIN